jgi:hypothetical protein
MSKAFPSKPLDLEKELDKGSISWNHIYIESLLEVTIAMKKEGHIRDGGCFTLSRSHIHGKIMNRGENIPPSYS